MLNFNVPQNGKVRVVPGPQNYLNAPLVPTPFGVGFNAGPDPQVINMQPINGAPGEARLLGKASSAIGSSSTFTITGPGQGGATVTLVCEATIVAPLPPPPDPAAIDHFVPVADPPELQ